MELLSPAGNYDKFLTALDFGADAVYFAGQAFGLRAFAGNFSIDQIKAACQEAHKRGKKVYVTVNIIAKDEDFNGLKEYLQSLSDANVDAVIVADIGIIRFIRKNFPNMEIHVSTQANITNTESALFFADMGVKRVVLARELNLTQVKKIATVLKERGVEVECFVHGAMCISYSGRCLLSNYLACRDANHGECVQACRWRYFVREEKRDSELEVEEDNRGTYIFNSKDMCMIQHLKELQDAGVASLKIEGRMKSEYYVACVTNAYRKAIDMLPKKAGDEFVTELEKTSHRLFSTGFYFKEAEENLDSSSPVQTHEFVGVVKDCQNGVTTIEQRNFLKEDDEVEVLSPDDKVFNKTFKITNMKNKDGESIEKANMAQMLFTCECDLPLNKGDYLRKKI